MLAGTKLCVGSSLFCFCFYSLCYAAVLLKFICYAQYYAQEQELLWDYYAFYKQICMSSSLHVVDNFIKRLECINERYQGIPLFYHMVTVLLEYIDCSLQVSTNA